MAYLQVFAHAHWTSECHWSGDEKCTLLMLSYCCNIVAVLLKSSTTLVGTLGKIFTNKTIDPSIHLSMNGGRATNEWPEWEDYEKNEIMNGMS